MGYEWELIEWVEEGGLVLKIIIKKKSQQWKNQIKC